MKLNLFKPSKNTQGCLVQLTPHEAQQLIESLALQVLHPHENRREFLGEQGAYFSVSVEEPELDCNERLLQTTDRMKTDLITVLNSDDTKEREWGIQQMKELSLWAESWKVIGENRRRAETNGVRGNRKVSRKKGVKHAPGTNASTRTPVPK